MDSFFHLFNHTSFFLPRKEFRGYRGKRGREGVAAMALLQAFFLVLLAMIVHAGTAEGYTSKGTLATLRKINAGGPYLGIVVPNAFEMNPLLNSSSFKANTALQHLDVAGRRFRFGSVEGKKVIIVMTGLSMVNAGITTQLLLTLFKVKGVVHYGIAGNANSALEIGDVTIPQYWAHTGLWNWQRYGAGPKDALPLESSGDYTRDIGHLHFADFHNITGTGDNLLNNVWYQPEEVFPVDGTPEVRQHAFWVPVDTKYFRLSKDLESLKLGRCINSTTCLPRAPVTVRVSRGVSANVYLDNAAYRNFIFKKFNVTPVDMESAAIALICHQQRTPFIIIRSLSDLAGGGSALSNEADTYSTLAAQNAVSATIKFIQLLSD